MQNVQEGEETESELGYVIFREREREHLLSRIPTDRTIDFRRSKK